MPWRAIAYTGLWRLPAAHLTAMRWAAILAIPCCAYMCFVTPSIHVQFMV